MRIHRSSPKWVSALPPGFEGPTSPLAPVNFFLICFAVGPLTDLLLIKFAPKSTPRRKSLARLTEEISSGAQGSRPSAVWGKTPRMKIRITMIATAANDSLLTGIEVTLAAAGCQYIALTTLR
jgi:hypothetical protein